MPGAPALPSPADKKTRGTPPQPPQDPVAADNLAAGKITSTAQLQSAVANLVSVLGQVVRLNYGSRYLQPYLQPSPHFHCGFPQSAVSLSL